MDTLSRAERSELMSKIRGDNLKPEAKVKSALKLMQIAHKRNTHDLPGKPDFVVGKIVLFVHGCFWHSCRMHFRAPRSNKRFWAEKMAENKKRDARVAAKLRRLGYSVQTLWEHDTSDICRLSEKLNSIFC